MIEGGVRRVRGELLPVHRRAGTSGSGIPVGPSERILDRVSDPDHTSVVNVYRLVVVAIVSALTLTSCGSDEGGSEETDPFEILYVSGITGLLSTSAKAFERGIKAHVEYLNENDGVTGREVRLTVKDNQSDPTRGVTLVQESLSSDARPDVVLPGVSSNETLAVAPLLMREKVPVMASISSPALDDVEQFPYMFSYCALQRDYLVGGLEFMKNSGDLNRVALVVPNDALGDGVIDGFEEIFADVDTEVIQFDGESVDFTPAFQKAAAFDPDWIITEGAGAQVPAILSSRVKAGAEEIPTIAGVTASTQPLLEISQGKQLNNLYATMLPLQAYVEPEDRSDEFNEFAKRVNAQGPLEQPLATYAAGWDLVGLWARGVEQTGGDGSAEAITEALENLELTEDDKQFPMFGGDYTTESHFPQNVEDYMKFGVLKSEKDGMLVIE